jgi:hypothetical protein
MNFREAAIELMSAVTPDIRVDQANALIAAAQVQALLAIAESLEKLACDKLVQREDCWLSASLISCAYAGSIPVPAT